MRFLQFVNNEFPCFSFPLNFFLILNYLSPENHFGYQIEKILNACLMNLENQGEK